MSQITQQSLQILRYLWCDLVLPAIDLAAIFAALILVRCAFSGSPGDETLLLGLIAVLVFLIVARLTGLHQRSIPPSADTEVAMVMSTWALTVIGLSLLALATRGGQYYARSELFSWFVVAPAMIGLGRMGARMLQQGLFRGRGARRRVAVAGFNQLGRRVVSQLTDDTNLGWQFVGYYDDRVDSRDTDAQSTDVPLAGGLDSLVQQARQGRIDTLLVTLPMRAEERIRRLLAELADSTASVYVVPDIFVFELLHARWIRIGPLSAVSIYESPLDGLDGVAKRLTDLVIGAMALVAVTIPMLLIAVAVKLSSPGPVFFRQRRYGLDGREMYVWKFRTMTSCDDGPQVRQATRGDARITPIGAVLRKTSLDELPQLFNVLAGNMSLVGPRPHATAHNEEYRRLIHGYMLRHKVKPGITGLAQVSGCRGETDTLDKMQQRIELDHQYIRSWSLWLDIKILLRTLWVAWRQPEAY